MFDIGWTELALVALVALLVIGPKELPATMRMIAGWIGKIRGLAREFQSGLDDMMRETELDKLKEQAQGVMHGDLDGMVENTIDPDGKIRDELDYGAYEPFGDFDPPETEPKTETDAKADGKTAGESAAAAKTTKKKSTAKASSGAAAKTTKATKTTAKKTAAKPRAKAGTKTGTKAGTKAATKSASKSATTATAKAAPRKRSSAAKPSSPDAGQTDA